MKALVYRHDATPSYPWIHVLGDTATYQCASPVNALIATLFPPVFSLHTEHVFEHPECYTFYYYEHDPYLELPELFI
jgi:hypothetical protein